MAHLTDEQAERAGNIYRIIVILALFVSLWHVASTNLLYCGRPWHPTCQQNAR